MRPEDLELIEDHLLSCLADGLARTTCKARRAALHRLAIYLELRGTSLVDAGVRDVRAWQGHLVSETPGADGRRSLVKHARGFYRWAIETDVVADPKILMHLKPPKVRKRVPHPFPESELARALREAPARIRPWLLFGTFMGLRAAEIAWLRAEDLDLDRRLLRVVGKGDKERVVVMAEVFVELLRELYLPAEGWLFPKLSQYAPHHPTGEHVTAGQVSKLTNRYLHRDAGTAATLHWTRHRFATDLLRLTGSLEAVRDALGHADITTATLYARADPTHLVAGVDAVGARFISVLGINRLQVA